MRNGTICGSEPPANPAFSVAGEKKEMGAPQLERVPPAAEVGMATRRVGDGGIVPVPVPAHIPAPIPIAGEKFPPVPIFSGDLITNGSPTEIFTCHFFSFFYVTYIIIWILNEYYQNLISKVN